MRPRPRGCARLFALVLVAALPACALTSKAKPIDVRYFALDAEPTTLTAAEVVGTPPPRLALGHVTSSDFLRNPIVFRTSSHEVGTYDDQRWTEYPETYVRRSLFRALFESGAFVEALGSRVPAVDVEVIAFEEVMRGPLHQGRVQLSYRLHDERTVLASGLINVERVAAGEGSLPAVVDAIGAAMNEATAQLGRQIRSRMVAMP